jgi:hypothetical protein
MSDTSITVEVKHTTDLALLVTDGDSEAWIPKSEISPDSQIDRDSMKGDTGELCIPEWLAINEGLV